MTIALPAGRPPVARPRPTRPAPPTGPAASTRSVPADVARADHPHGDVPFSAPPAAPLAVVLLGMLVVLAGLVAGGVLLVVHLLGLVG
ncbi:hypothetical protein ACFFOM_20275 [Microlunatus capsulatus]|uniref:Uncharacterized protein n=1 Tax=Microlunatus capsulatus TaxID=99117 RepID=A0ABS4ZDJ3_9ACTN|nr:hypothetical protein [Microlunatus capsulatus]MBP2419107.1 hypothetical protein [Microlunatus capsulatus]